MKENEVELLDRVKDRITGFEGLAWSWVKFATGCDRIGILPTETRDGKLVEVEYFDLPRVEIVKKQSVSLSPKPAETKKSTGPGGMEAYPKHTLDPR